MASFSEVRELLGPTPLLGGAVYSLGVTSGSVVQTPVHIPVNVCGDTASVIGLLNPIFGNTCN